MLAASLPTFARRLCVNSKVLTWVSNSATVGRFLRLAAADSRQIDRWQWKCADRQMISNYVYELSKASRLRVGGCVLFDMSRAKIKGKTGVQCSSERTQNLPVFIRSGFPQIASAAHLQRCYVVSHLFRQNKRVSSSFTIIHLSHNHVSSEWPPIGSTVFCCCFFALFFPCCFSFVGVTLYLLTCRVRVIVGDSGFRSCVCVTSFSRQLAPFVCWLFVAFSVFA